MKSKLSPCKVVPAGDPNPRTHATYKREVQALLQATYNYTPAEAKHATSPADWGQLVRTAWASGKAPCWSADAIAAYDKGVSPSRKKTITRKRSRDPVRGKGFARHGSMFKHSRLKWYVGKTNSGKRVPFSSLQEPTQESHGDRYRITEGPFKTKGGAEHFAFVWNNGGQITQDMAERSIKRPTGRDPNCFRSSRANLHTHTVCPSKPGVYTTSKDFAHTHTVKFKKGALVRTSEDYGHTHDFDFSVTNGRDATYRRSAKSKRKLARRATSRCTTLLKRLTKLAETSVKYRRAGRNLASKDAWTLMEKVSGLALKAGCGEVQVSEAVEDGLALGRKAK